MSSCLSTETLNQLVAGTLDESLSAAALPHLHECARCQAEMDRLSDDAELRRWLARDPRAPFPEPSEPLLDQAVRLVSDSSRHKADEADMPEPLPTFLGPPRQAGDLGTLGLYRIEAELGRGGMGLVFRGFDESLRRTVAIKVLRPELAGPRARERLVREAQAAARFEHDHVVRVYAVVNPPDGLPYLVMEYLEGPTLAVKIRARGYLTPAEAADAIAQAADGLAAAHAVGLVHRDVKPSNLLFDANSGRVKILDFGLVRSLDGASGVTQEGVLAGTPSYMSPEQVREPAAVDGRSDVYSLGTTLYEALTGAAPFEGTPHMVLQQILNDEPRPPRRLNDSIPADLETICLKAMAREPARRYAGARALADDLRRWQRGEPIHARPAGSLERGWRWCRRNPRLAGLTAAVFVLLLVLAVGSTTAAILVGRAKGEAERDRGAALEALGKADASAAAARAAQQESATHAQAAQAHFGLALDTLNTLINKVQQQLGKKPGTLALQRQILETALAELEKIARSAETTPGADASLVKAHERLGDLFFLIGKTDKAEKQFTLARDRAQELDKEKPNDVEVKKGLASAYDRLGMLHLLAGRFDPAEEHYKQALAIREARQKAGPITEELRRDLSVSFNKLGDVNLRRGDPAKAIDWYEKALTLREQDEQSANDRSLWLTDIAFTHGRVGDASLALGDFDAAGRHFRRALDTATELPGVKNNELPARVTQTLYFDRLGSMLVRQGEYAEAEKWYAKSLAIRREAAQADPDSAEAQRSLGVSLSLTGDALMRAGKLDAAREPYLQVLAIGQELAREDPGSVQKLNDLAVSYSKLIDLEERAEHYDQALKWVEEVMEHCRKLESSPTMVGPAKNWLGGFEIDRQVYGLAKNGLEVETEQAPTGLLRLRCISLARHGKHKEAAEIAEKLYRLAPNDPIVQAYVSRCYALCAACAADDALRREYEGKAVAVLDYGLKRQRVPAFMLEMQPDLNPLRKNASYQELVRGLYPKRVK